MKIQFNRGIRRKLKLSINDPANCTIKDIKSKLEFRKFLRSKKRRIFTSYIILEIDDIVQEDSNHLRFDNPNMKLNVNFKISVAWKLECEENDNIKRIIMNYNDSVKDLNKSLSKELKVPILDILCVKKLQCKESTCNEKKLLRHILRLEDGQIFTIRVGKSNENVESISLKIINNLDETLEEKITNIIIPPRSSVDDLRRIIIRDLKIELCNFDINLNEIILVKGDLSHYNIKNDDTLVVKRSKCLQSFNKQFVINVRNNEDKEMKYLIDDHETVGALKVILREQYNVNIGGIMLTYNDKELCDDDIIRNGNIEDGSTFLLTIQKKKIDNEENIRIKVVNGLKEKFGDNESEVIVCGNDTIEILRQRIEAVLLGLSQAKYVISYRGEIMKNENVINTYNISDGDEVLLSSSLIIRYFMAGNNSAAKVNRYAFVGQDTVSKLKSKITKKLNLEPRFIHLTNDGKMLEDDMVLEDNGIENDSYLMMISSLAGGC